MAEFTKTRMLEARERWPNITGPKSLAAAVQSDSDDLPDALDMLEKMAEALGGLVEFAEWLDEYMGTASFLAADKLDLNEKKHKARALLATWETKMADIADIANDRADTILDAAFHNHRASIQPPAAATGKCLFCEEPVDAPRRWCDNDCRDGWERERG